MLGGRADLLFLLCAEAGCADNQAFAGCDALGQMRQCSFRSGKIDQYIESAADLGQIGADRYAQFANAGHAASIASLRMNATPGLLLA